MIIKEECFLEHKLSLYHYSLVTDMLRKVTDNLAQSNENARKELDELMGGKILRFQNEDLFDAQEFRDIEKMIKNAGMTPKQAMDALEVDSDKRETYMKKLSEQKELVEA